MKHLRIAAISIALFSFSSCLALLGDPVRLYVTVDYPGKWTGYYTAEDYYGDSVPTNFSESAAVETIGGSGEQSYTIIPDKNLYFFSATRLTNDAGSAELTNALALDIYVMNLNTSEKVLLLSLSTTNAGGTVSTNFYTSDYTEYGF